MEKNKKESVFEKFLNSQFYKSIIRSGVPKTRRQRMYAVLGNVFLHLHPARLPRHAVKIGYTWCMGGLSFFLFVLMTLTMFLSFTGYLLPWDQLAIWAITVGTNMARAHPFIGSEGPGASLLTIGDLNLVTASSDVRYALLGGRFVGEATLLRFYVLHCILVPFIAMIFMAVHFWRIRKDGGISGPL